MTCTPTGGATRPSHKHSSPQCARIWKICVKLPARTARLSCACNRRYVWFITARHLPCRLAQKSKTHLSVQRIEAAADPDGTSLIARMEPCFPVSVKIAAVLAARDPHKSAGSGVLAGVRVSGRGPQSWYLCAACGAAAIGTAGPAARQG